MRIGIARQSAILAIVILQQYSAAQEIRIAAAADLESAFDQVGTRFKNQTGTDARLTYGSSGNFFHQIESGAPFDMFFSANRDYAKGLESEGFAVPGTYYEYARGKIVLWFRTEVPVEHSRALDRLVSSSIRKVAIASPDHAPYGQAAIAALKSEGIYDKVQSKLVFGENVSQAASFVVSGAADVGIIALSLALSPNMRSRGHYVEIPSEDYPAIEQACVILRSSRNKQGAQQFLAFIKTAEIAQLLRSYGFDVPEQGRR